MALMLLTTLAAANCVPAPAADKRPPRAGMCDAGRIADVIGKTATNALVADAKRRSGAKGVRRIAPGMMVTMDYSAERLNLMLDAKNRITKITCG